MRYAWVVRPYPDGQYRGTEFLTKNFVAIGWPGISDLAPCETREDIKTRLSEHGYEYGSARSLGQAAGNIYRFIHEIQVGDFVLVPDGPEVYIGTVVSEYVYDSSIDTSDEGYPHQRQVEWCHEKRAIPRNFLPGRLFDALKGQQTVYSTYHDDVEDIVTNHGRLFTGESNYDLKVEYLKRLSTGRLLGMNSNLFENAVCGVYRHFFPGLRRLSTTNSNKGDTDLLAELPGGVTVRIQVKYFYTDQGALEASVVDQLAESMDPGDHGIIVTSGTISEAATKKAKTIPDKSISFIDGPQFVEHLL
jgi:restriction system protein